MPPPEIVETVALEPVSEVPPIDIAAIAVVEPVMEPELIAVNAVIDPPITAPVEILPAEEIADVVAEPVEVPMPPPALEILSLERVDKTMLPSRAPRSWRYSVSRWAYRWWLWTREAFRNCFPVSK